MFRLTRRQRVVLLFVRQKMFCCCSRNWRQRRSEARYMCSESILLHNAQIWAETKTVEASPVLLMLFLSALNEIKADFTSDKRFQTRDFLFWLSPSTSYSYKPSKSLATFKIKMASCCQKFSVSLRELKIGSR